jgi:DNA-binding CsgD family transcriptional regulator
MSTLLGVETFSTIRADGQFYHIASVIFYILAFLIFFYLMFSDKLMVFLNEPKSKLSLEAKGLTDTESGYILSIISGKSVKETAFEAGVSESTVRNTIARGYKKLGVLNKSGLMALSEKYDITS